MNRACVRAAAVTYGAERRVNDWYVQHRPEVLRSAMDKGLARAFSTADPAGSGFDARMAPFLADPFRGAKVRYLLGPGETALGLELAAARQALVAARLLASEVDVILCASWLPERFVPPGDAVFIARELGVSAPAYNVETACSSGLACLELAEGLLAVGRYHRVLVVLSSTNSRQTGDDDTLGWISSDVAAALIVERGAGPEGILASYVENTAPTCGVFEHRLVVGADGAPRVRMAVGEGGSKALRDSTGPELVRRACLRAVARARVALDDIAFFGFSTPLAWYEGLCREALGIPAHKSRDLFPRLANVGAPFPAVHLHHAIAEGRLRPGELAVLFTVGSVSSAGAMVLRVGEVAVAPMPVGGLS